MKSFLLLAFFVGLVSAHMHGTNVFTLPSGGTPTLALNYVGGSKTTFQIESVVGDQSTQLSDTMYIGLGFQNNVSVTAAASDLSMFGPEGTDFFIMHGTSSKVTTEFRTLDARTPSSPKGSLPMARESYTSDTTNFPAGSRITAVSIATSTPLNYTTYTATINCAKGSTGKVDFLKPVAVLYAFGAVSSAGVIEYHGTGPANRGWKRADSTSTGQLQLYTICSGSGAPVPNVVFFMTIIVAAALTVFIM